MSNPQSTFFSETELATLGLKRYGTKVLISKKASLIDPSRISLGDNVRIDDFSLLSGDITIGSQVHISAFVGLFGAFGITIDDYAGVSSHSLVYSATDDFSGEYLVGPLVQQNLRHLISGSVHISKFVQIGASNVVMPGLEMGEGAATGAFCFVNSNLEPWTISVGIPNKILRNRSKNMVMRLKKEMEHEKDL